MKDTLKAQMKVSWKGVQQVGLKGIDVAAWKVGLTVLSKVEATVGMREQEMVALLVPRMVGLKEKWTVGSMVAMLALDWAEWMDLGMGTMTVEATEWKLADARVKSMD